MKTCPQCQLTKEFSQFHKDKYNKEGYQPYCKVCRAQNYRMVKSKQDKLAPIIIPVNNKPTELPTVSQIIRNMYLAAAKMNSKDTRETRKLTLDLIKILS